MRNNTLLKKFAAVLLILVMAIGAAACNSDTQSDTPNTQSNAPSSAPSANPSASGASAPVNTSPITIVWYPNEAASDYEPAREEFGRLISEATNREVRHNLTTDYVIAIEAIASGAADIGAIFGAVGFIEAQQRNPAVQSLIVNSGSSGTLDDAIYYSWLAVNKGDETQYSSGSGYSIENIQGKRMSFVSNSSTSGFVVPSSGIFSFFGQTAEWSDIDEDDILGLSRNPFFSEVLFGGSHQGSLFNLLDGRADIAAICDTCVDAYVELASGEPNTIGSVYAIHQTAADPFEGVRGSEFFLINVVPVLNGPIVYNPQNLSDGEIQAIRNIMTSDETADNPLMFGEGGGFSFYTKSGDSRFVVAENSWYDPLR